MTRLSISLLGTYRVLLGDTEITGFDSDKVRALLAYLVVESGRPHRRETLAGLLWPDRPERTARHNLSQALFNLRALLKDAAAGEKGTQPVLVADRQTVRFDETSDHWLDVTQFATLLGACGTHPHRRLDLCKPCIERLHQASALYTGSFLAGFSLGDSPAFEEWMLARQERCHRQAVGALRRLARCYERRTETDRALHFARRLVQLEPWRENAHRQVMRLLAASGQRNAALAQYETCRQVLQAELGVEPAKASLDLYHAIRAGIELPPDTSLPPHNLPAPTTPLIGRESELVAIGVKLRDRECRLLTLVGPGGSGKTRLAIEAARDVLYGEGERPFAHGICFCSLAPLQSPEAIVPALAQALGFVFHRGDDPQQQLLAYLRRRAVLLVLDNAEHLLGSPRREASVASSSQTVRQDGAGVVSDLLRGAPDVKILVTSRARLNVRGEHLWPVPGLDAPASPRADRLESTPPDPARYSAVELFLEGARRVRPGYQPAESDLAQIGRICRLVRGMPLGILLAAAWIRLLSPADIATQMGQSLDFLQDDVGDVPLRQRSVRATYEYSWALLTGREREVFRGCSVFSGGFGHRAAQQVVGTTLRELRELVDRSMLECGPDGRYAMHELLRQYGRERLARVPAEEQAIQDRHCAYYAGYLQDREAALIGPKQGEALAEIEVEIDNLRMAWDWAVAQGKIADLDRALESLAEFYHVRARFQEGEAALARAAERLARERPAASSGSEAMDRSMLVLGRILSQQGRFCHALGLVEQASSLLEKSLAILRELDARRDVAYALSYLGRLLTEKGTPQLEQALDLFGQVGDQRGTADSLRVLGSNLVIQGEFKAATQHFQSSLTLFQKLGNPQGIAGSLRQLGYVAFALGEYGEAKRLHQKSYALAREIGDQDGIAAALSCLARDACGLEEYEEGKQLYEKSLALFRDVGNMSRIALVLGDLSELATVLGQYAEATQLAQESLAIDEKLDRPAEMAWATRVLANVARERGDLEGARNYLRQALEMGMSVRATIQVLITLVGIAALRMREGRKGEAAELLGLVLSHRSTRQWTKDRAAPLVAQLEAELSPEVFAATQKRGKGRDLEQVVAELLADQDGGYGNPPYEEATT